MNRINEKGLKMLEYKKELLKNYPQLVKDSLLLSIEQLVENKIIDLDSYYVIKDSSKDCKDLEEYIMTKTQYVKTAKELFEEFEKIREKFNDFIISKNIYNEVITKSIVEKDVVSVTKKFCIDEKFAIEYFGLKETDLLKLMKRGDFIEKFAVLRLTKIFNDFVTETNISNDKFDTEISLVYFDVEKNGYSIDINFYINIEILEKEEFMECISDNISYIVKKAISHYNNKMIM